MNKKDISSFKKELKNENTGRLRIGEIYNAYCRADKQKILHSEVSRFESHYDEDTMDMFHNNFKKLLTGKLGAKLFELDFEKTDDGKQGQELLYTMIDCGDFKSKAEEITNTILLQNQYGDDFLISIARVDYYIPHHGRENTDELEEEDKREGQFTFLLCSINGVEKSQKALKYDSSEKELIAQSSVDAVIDLNRPLDGFLYPVIDNGVVDVNKVLYCSTKNNFLNKNFVNGILKCSIILTSKQEKDLFKEVLTVCLGETTSSETLYKIYKNISDYCLLNETGVINTEKVKEIMKDEGLNVDNFDEMIANQLSVPSIDLNAKNLIPEKGKSIKIETNDVNLTVTANVLRDVKQVINNGKRYLMVKIDEPARLDNFELDIQ